MSTTNLFDHLAEPFEPAGVLIVPDDIPDDTLSCDEEEEDEQPIKASDKDCTHHMLKGKKCAYQNTCIFRHGKRDSRPTCFSCNKRRISHDVETCDHCLRVQEERGVRRDQAQKRDAKKKQSFSTCRKCSGEKIKIPGGGSRELYCKKCDKLHQCCNSRCSSKMACRGVREVKCRDCHTTHTCSKAPKNCRDLHLEPHRYSCGYCRSCHQASLRF